MKTTQEADRELKKKIKEYQKSYSSKMKFYKSFGFLPEWEFRLLLDIGALKVKNNVLMVAHSLFNYENYLRVKGELLKIKMMTGNKDDLTIDLPFEKPLEANLEP